MQLYLSKDAQHVGSFSQELSRKRGFKSMRVANLPDNFKNKVRKTVFCGIDFETTGLDIWRDKILLTSLYFPELDLNIVSNVNFKELDSLFNLSSKQLVAHNAAYEYEMAKVSEGIELKHIYCTLLVEQKLNMGKDIRNDLVSVVMRRCPEKFNWDMQKDIAKQFVGQDPKTFYPTVEQVLYSGADTEVLFDIKNLQQKDIEEYGYEYNIYKIHLPLLPILSDIKIHGITVNENKFKARADKIQAEIDVLDDKLNRFATSAGAGVMNISSVFKEKEKLEKAVSRYAKVIRRNKKLYDRYTATGKTHLKAYRYVKDSLVRNVPLYKQKKQELDNFKASINWGSTAQVMEFFKIIGLRPLPTDKSSKNRKLQQPSMSKKARQKWLLKNPNHKFRNLIIILNKRAGLVKQVNTFGHSFLTKYYNSVTGKYHTLYKQGTVATGRLASGDKSAPQPCFNSQQLPAIKELRECFGEEPDYYIWTGDLSGAELVTMCSLAQDHKLLKLSEGDMHSYFANLGWKAIYKYRGIPYTEKDVISKTQNSHLRTAYKPMTFGAVYGLHDKGAGETLNVTETEGGIALRTIQNEIPATFRMVKEAVSFMYENGYVIHNTRTNSRRWFSPVLDMLKGRTPQLSFSDKLSVEGAARNTRVQGTQADMLSESMVNIHKFITKHQLDARILLQVHDEIAVKFHKKYLNKIEAPLASIMTKTANLYLEGGVQMKCDYTVKPYWTKDS